MSEIAEIRKLFQDLIAPDLKSVATDLAALKTSVDQQFKAMKQSMDIKFDSAEALERARYETLVAKIEAIRIEFGYSEAAHLARHEAVLKALDIDRRLERVEARQDAASQVA